MNDIVNAKLMLELYFCKIQTTDNLDLSFFLISIAKFLCGGLSLKNYTYWMENLKKIIHFHAAGAKILDKFTHFTKK